MKPPKHRVRDWPGGSRRRSSCLRLRVLRPRCRRRLPAASRTARAPSRNPNASRGQRPRLSARSKAQRVRRRAALARASRGGIRRRDPCRETMFESVRRCSECCGPRRWKGIVDAKTAGRPTSGDPALRSLLRPAFDRTRRHPSCRCAPARPAPLTTRGTSKACRSSPSSRSASPRATCTRTSSPARSTVRNVALLGRPIAGPVMASTSSTV